MDLRKIFRATQSEAWRETVQAACLLSGRDYTTQLSAQLAAEHEAAIHFDEQTLEVTVDDAKLDADEIVGEVEEYVPPQAVGVVEHLQREIRSLSQRIGMADDTSVDGDPWEQSLGVLGTYRVDAIRTHDGLSWRNTYEGNPFPPGVYGWEQVLENDEIEMWVQKFGGDTLYQVGSVVHHDGGVWESEHANNVWIPGAWGWKYLHPYEPDAALEKSAPVLGGEVGLGSPTGNVRRL